jgi:hypothetical protein
VQNINIVYKVDRSEVERSNQAVQQARDLTDRLKNSARQMGDQGAKSNKQFQGSIESVRVKMAQLRAQIENTNRSDTKRMNDLIKQYHQAQKEVDTFNKKLKEQSTAASNASGGINKAASAFNNMYQAIRLVVGAAVVRELVNTTMEAATLAGQVETVGRAFNRQIPQAELVLGNLRRATRNTVGDLELMQRALSFKNFGGDVEALPKLLEFAAVRAQQTGQSVDYLVDSIVNGIGRKSALILDNLGISAQALKEELGGVSTQAASVAEVSAAVGRIAERELAKMGGFAENAATSVEQLKVSWQGLRIEIANAFTSAAGSDFATFLKGYVDSFQALFEAYNKNISVSDLFTERKRKEAAQLTVNEYNQNVLNKSKEENIDLINAEIARITSLLGAYAKERDTNLQLIGQMREMWAAREGNQYQIEEAIELQQKHLKVKENDALLDQEILKLLIAKRDAMQKQNAEQKVEIESLDVLRKRLTELQRIRDEEVSIYDKASLDYYQREINLLEDRIAKIDDNIAWEIKWNEQGKISRKGIEEFNASLRDSSKAIEDLSKKYSPIIEKLGKFDFGDIEVEAEVTPTFKLDNEKWVRFRIEMKEWFAQNQEELTMEGIDFGANMIMTMKDIEIASLQERIDAHRNFYKEQQDLAGNNERFKRELQIKEQRETLRLQRELALKQKQARIFGIVVDTAASIAKAWVNPGYPGAIPLSIFLAAQGAAQIAAVNSAPLGFKDGVIDLKGPGTMTSDSIPAKLSRGESVMTAKETKSSMQTLKMIRAGMLDDRTVAKLAARAKGGDSTIFDDTRLVKVMSEVAKNTAGADIIRKGSVIYEAKKEGDNFTRYTRAKIVKSWD